MENLGLPENLGNRIEETKWLVFWLVSIILTGLAQMKIIPQVQSELTELTNPI